MNILKIEHWDDKNGQGARLTIFVAGCSFKCKGCFNYKSWSYLSGYECTDELMNSTFDLFDNNKEFLSGLSILGGEPLAPRNFKRVVEICSLFKSRFPEKNIWLWSGYTIEDLKTLPQATILQIIDILVDGQFIEELQDDCLEFRGSSNQRILRKGADF